MNAAKIANSLKLAGIAIKDVVEGTDEADGMVEITDLVHVQIPTYDRTVNVVSESSDGESFVFYPERAASDIAGILADIRKACGIVAPLPSDDTGPGLECAN